MKDYCIDAVIFRKVRPKPLLLFPCYIKDFKNWLLCSLHSFLQHEQSDKFVPSFLALFFSFVLHQSKAIWSWKENFCNSFRDSFVKVQQIKKWVRCQNIVAGLLSFLQRSLMETLSDFLKIERFPGKSVKMHWRY